MINDVKQGPHHATLMSCVKAAYEFYHKKEMSNSMLYGLSGHAFIINITNGLGPCAPYVWDMKEFSNQCDKYLGISIFNDKNVILQDTPTDQKQDATKQLKK